MQRSTTQNLLTALKTSITVADETANFIYGATVGAHVVAKVIQHPLLSAGIESSILNSIPMVGIGISVLRGLCLCGDLIFLKKQKPIFVLANALSTLSLSSTLCDLAWKNRSQIMAIGSTAFGSVCFGFAAQALGDFIVALIHFKIEEKTPSLFSSDVNKKAAYNKALDKFIVSTLNLIGWGALAFAHLSIVAAIASPLLMVGAASLVIGALYAADRVIRIADTNKIQLKGSKPDDKHKNGGESTAPLVVVLENKKQEDKGKARVRAITEKDRREFQQTDDQKRMDKDDVRLALIGMW